MIRIEANIYKTNRDEGMSSVFYPSISSSIDSLKTKRTGLPEGEG